MSTATLASVELIGYGHDSSSVRVSRYGRRSQHCTHPDPSPARARPARTGAVALARGSDDVGRNRHADDAGPRRRRGARPRTARERDQGSSRTPHQVRNDSERATASANRSSPKPWAAPGTRTEAGVAGRRAASGHRDRHVDILLAVDQQHGDPQPRQLGVDVQVPYVGDVTTPEGDVTAIDAVREVSRHGRARAEERMAAGRRSAGYHRTRALTWCRPPDRQGCDEPALAPSEQGRPADVDEGHARAASSTASRSAISVSTDMAVMGPAVGACLRGTRGRRRPPRPPRTAARCRPRATPTPPGHGSRSPRSALPAAASRGT